MYVQISPDDDDDGDEVSLWNNQSKARVLGFISLLFWSEASQD